MMFYKNWLKTNEKMVSTVNVARCLFSIHAFYNNSYVQTYRHTLTTNWRSLQLRSRPFLFDSLQLVTFMRRTLGRW